MLTGTTPLLARCSRCWRTPIRSPLNNRRNQASPVRGSRGPPDRGSSLSLSLAGKPPPAPPGDPSSAAAWPESRSAYPRFDGFLDSRIARLLLLPPTDDRKRSDRGVRFKVEDPQAQPRPAGQVPQSMHFPSSPDPAPRPVLSSVRILIKERGVEPTKMPPARCNSVIIPMFL